MTTSTATSTVTPAVAPSQAAPSPADEDLGQGGRAPYVGAARSRVDGPLKVTGTAPYAYEHDVENPCYAWPALATVARGRVSGIECGKALATPGVLHVLTHESAPRLRVKTDAELWILQNEQVHFRGQVVAVVVAETPEAAREGAERVQVSYEEEPATLVFDPDSPESVQVKRVLGTRPGTESEGDVAAGLARAAHRVEAQYELPMEHHNPIEPHAVTAIWHEVNRLDPRATRLTLFDTNQGPVAHQALLAPLLGLLPNQLQIISPYVGGGFGSKGMPHAQLVVAALAAKVVSPRPVRVALTRQMMFALVGYRPRSVQRIRLGSDAAGHLTAVEHVSIQATSRLKRSVDQSCLTTRMMYATGSRHTEHRAVDLDVPPSTFMRAPGDFTGMYALETALDELAHASGVDPIELRLRNEPDVDPETGKPWSTRNLVACLERGAQLFDWSRRQAPGQQRDGEWRHGLGVASATFPNSHMVSLFARVSYLQGQYVVQMQAADIGTGTHTVLPQIAADALGVDVSRVVTDIGRTQTPMAMLAGGSAGTYEWGNAVVAACHSFLRRHGRTPNEGDTAMAQGRPPRGASKYSRHAFGAHFAEVAVSAATGEVHVRRMLGVYAAGTIVNPTTARSQMLGGMTMAISAALHEESVLDPRFGHVVNGDLAGYHIAAHADIPELQVEFLPEHDPWFGSVGSKGIGELPMVGSPAAIGNAIFNATGRRLRSLPFTPQTVLEG